MYPHPVWPLWLQNFPDCRYENPNPEFSTPQEAVRAAVKVHNLPPLSPLYLFVCLFCWVCTLHWHSQRALCICVYVPFCLCPLSFSASLVSLSVSLVFCVRVSIFWCCSCVYAVLNFVCTHVSLWDTPTPRSSTPPSKQRMGTGLVTMEVPCS